jgi:uncharacterized protein
MNGETEGGTQQPALETTISTPQPPQQKRGMEWIFMGPQGMRAGWSAAIFLAIFVFLMVILYAVEHQIAVKYFHQPEKMSLSMSPASLIIGDGTEAVCLLVAMAIMALIERRRIRDYNLRGTGSMAKFVSGLVFGFAALSALVGIMAMGGWMRFGPVALSGGEIVKYAALWAVGFLCVGLTEEGVCRCYLQFTFTRGINFWWALGIVAFLCAVLIPNYKNQGNWGVFIFAALGLLPCLWLHFNKAPGGAFWQAAWAVSTFFGFVHTGNNGETWIGIFAAAAIGFVFCVSVRVTGSAWWAIGCHMAWDWAETYFYGTADSGFVAKGHLLTTTPVGSALWSGGTDGPEGSILVLLVIALLLAAVVAIYGRGKQAPIAVAAIESPAN